VRRGQLVAVAVALTVGSADAGPPVRLQAVRSKRKMVVCMSEMLMSESIHDMSNPAACMLTRKLAEKILRA